MATKILIVEDDKALQKSLNDLLQSEGYLTETASTGGDALRKVETISPDMILLDLGLPDIQGESILKIVRDDYPQTPVIILTAKSKPQEIAQGLNLGADDYLAKPFAVEELFARISARLKKRTNNNNVLVLEELTLDCDKMVANRDGKEILLTKTEFALLQFLMKNIGRVQSRDVILNHVWGYSTNVESRVVDIYIGYLRKKIDGGFNKELIKNKRGFGYLIDA